LGKGADYVGESFDFPVDAFDRIDQIFFFQYSAGKSAKPVTSSAASRSRVSTLGEIYVKVAGRWTYLFRAVDQNRQAAPVATRTSGFMARPWPLALPSEKSARCRLLNGHPTAPTQRHESARQYDASCNPK
jgi:hypothetical protein